MSEQLVWTEEEAAEMKERFQRRFGEPLPRTESLFAVAAVGYRKGLNTRPSPTEIEALRAEVERLRADRGSREQQPAATSKTVNVIGMPEFDGLLDHIYEHGTAAEGVTEKANAFARAVIARYAPQQSAAVDEAKEPDLWRCTVCGRVGTVGRCCGEETREPVYHAARQGDEQ